MRGLIAGALVLVALADVARGCGMSVHNEVAKRASHWFDHDTYAFVVRNSSEWVQPGTFFPDWGYSCADQADAAEYAHWPRYANATATYLKETYPKPWSLDVQHKVAFLLGFVAHAAADTVWHDLGFDHMGLMRALRNVEHHDSPDAHTIMDTGGEFTVKHFGDMDYIERYWYVPSDDLVAVYRREGYVGVTAAQLDRCMKLGFVGAWANKIAGEVLYPYVKDTPIFVSQIETAAPAGINDMATWTALCWGVTVRWLETDDSRRPFCKLLENHWGADKFVLHRKDTMLDAESLEAQLLALGFSVRMTNNNGVTKYEMYREDGVDVDEWLASERRIMAKQADAKVSAQPASKDQVECTPYTQLQHRRLATEVPYSQLGYAIVNGDFDGDGVGDIAVSAPYYGTAGNAQRGAVFILDGGSLGGGSGEVEEIEAVANQTLVGPAQYGVFGFSLVVVDLNADGIDDLAVSAPSVAMEQMYYDGAVYVYFGVAGSGLPSTPSLTLYVDQPIPDPAQDSPTWTWQYENTNLGFKLVAADIDGDGAKDLLIGAPFASRSPAEQQGLVLGFKSTSGHVGVIQALVAADIRLVSESDSFDWFGYAPIVIQTVDSLVLAVGEPGDHREELAAFGAVNFYRLSGLPGQETPVRLDYVAGTEQHEFFGSTIVKGDFYHSNDGVDRIAVSSPGHNEGEDAWQAGKLDFYEVGPTGAPALLLQLSGHKQGGHLGEHALAIVGGTFWVGEPMYGTVRDAVADVFTVETGRLLGITTGPSFPRGTLGSSVEDVASTCIAGAEPKERFGWAIASVAEGGMLAVGAPHSYAKSRLSGQLVLIQA